MTVRSLTVEERAAVTKTVNNRFKTAKSKEKYQKVILGGHVRVRYQTQGNFTICLLSVGKEALTIGATKRHPKADPNDDPKRAQLVALGRTVNNYLDILSPGTKRKGRR